MDVERIKFERTGGFAGMRIAAELEFEELPEDQAKTLKELLDDLDFGEMPEHSDSDSTFRDQFTYSITVEAREWQHTVVTSDASADEKMKELLELLNRLARTKMRKQ